MQGIGHWPRRWAEFAPHRVAISYQGKQINYHLFNQNINRLANALAGLEVIKGDRVGILLNNCTEYIEAVFACAKLGAIFVPINIRLAPEELEYLLANSDCKVVITELFFEGSITAVRNQVPVKNYVWLGGGPGADYEELLAKASDRDPDVEVKWYDDMFICYTSGTTGRPKGAVLTHNNVFWTAMDATQGLSYNYRDRYLMTLPLCFTGGLIPAAMPIYLNGYTMVLEKSFQSERVLELISKEHITVTSAVPTMFKMISDLPQFKDANLSSFRMALAGGAPVPVSLIETWREKGVPFNQAYGLTEGGGISLILPPQDAVRKVGFAGLPGFYNSAAVVDENGQAVSSNIEGELVFRGPQAMRCYWNNPVATAEALKDGWLYTGDVTICDEDGYYKIVDRKKDLIISGGLNVYPAEVEGVIYRCPEIAEVAVIGLPDDTWGEAVTAIIKLKPGQEITAEQVVKFCRCKLAAYKCPKRVTFWDDLLPRNAAGKILKRVLREQSEKVS